MVTLQRFQFLQKSRAISFIKIDFRISPIDRESKGSKASNTDLQLHQLCHHRDNEQEFQTRVRSKDISKEDTNTDIYTCFKLGIISCWRVLIEWRLVGGRHRDDSWRLGQMGGIPRRVEGFKASKLVELHLAQDSSHSKIWQRKISIPLRHI
jgi:hypothetical protein